MEVKGGFWGNLLRINLTDKSVSTEKLSADIFKKFAGGALLADKILYDEVKPHTDPLSADNKLVFFTGALTGTDAICASRMGVATKSPLTGTICNSFSGGFMPVEIKFAGYDIIVIEGKADEPVYITIKDDSVKIGSAKKYWGLNALDTQSYIKEDLHDLNYRVMCIGPAGENLSLLSSIMNEAMAMGRKGVGAVMGSKNLKAIAVRGTKTVPVHDPALLKEGIAEFLQSLKDCPIGYPVFSNTGSSCAVDAASGIGVFPANNFSETGVSDLSGLIGPSALAKYNKTRNICYKCPLGCSQVRAVTSGKYAGISSEGPEYETLYSFGSMLGINNPEFIIAMDRLCDELGIDTISAGVTISMAMELKEKGLLDDTDGLDLSFGNEDAARVLLHKMAFKEGIGKIFSDGTKKAAEYLGGEADYYAMHVKGLELPAYDIRGLKAHGLNFATSYNGADHNRGYAFQEVFGIPIPFATERLDNEGKAELAKFNQDFCGTYDVATLCEFPTQLAMPHNAQSVTAKMLTGVSGVTFTEADMWTLGERLYNITRMFNVREGFSRKDDTLPKRLMNEPIKEGLTKGAVISQDDLDFMLGEYYKLRGWDENGVPLPEKIQELGL